MVSNPNKYSAAAVLAILGMQVFGTATSIGAKLMLDTTACPRYDASEYPGIPKWEHGECPQFLVKKFSKPWFQTAAMFAAEAMCIFGHIFNLVYDDCKAKNAASA